MDEDATDPDDDSPDDYPAHRGRPPAKKVIQSTPRHTTRQEPRPDGGVIDPVDELRRILGNSGADKIEAIIDAYRMGDLDDLPKLYKLIRMSGKDKAAADLAVEAWAAYRDVEWDPGKAASINKSISAKGKDATPEEDDFKSVIKTIMKDRAKKLKEDMEMLEIINQAKAMGVDVTAYGIAIPAVSKQPDKPTPGNEKKLHVLPDGTEFTGTDDDFKDMLRTYYETHRDSRKMEKEDVGKTVPWESPYDHKIYNVPVDQLSTYLSITERHRVESSPKASPEYDDLKRRQDELEAQNRQYRELLSQKEKQEIENQLGGAYSKIDKLEKELEKQQKSDPIDSVATGWAKIQQRMDQFGWGPKGTSTAEQVALKKADVQGEVVSTSMHAIANKVSQSKFGTGDITNSILNSELVKGVVKDYMQKRNPPPPGQETDHADSIRNLDSMMDDSGNIQQETKQQVKNTTEPGDTTTRNTTTSPGFENATGDPA